MLAPSHSMSTTKTRAMSPFLLHLAATEAQLLADAAPQQLVNEHERRPGTLFFSSSSDNFRASAIKENEFVAIKLAVVNQSSLFV